MDNFQYTDFNTDIVKQLSASQIRVVIEKIEAATRVTDVLLCTDNIIINKPEAINKELRVSGKVYFKTLLKTEAGVEGITSVADFEASLVDEEITAKGNACVKGMVIDVETNIDDNIVNIVAIIELNAIYFEKRNIKALTACSDIAYTQPKVISLNEAFCREEVSILREEINLPNIEELYQLSVDAAITECVLEKQNVIIKGNLIANVVYKFDNDVNANLINIPFVEYIESEYTENTQLFVNAMVKKARIIINDSDNNVFLESEVGFSIFALSKSNADIIEDIYSTEYNLAPVFESYTDLEDITQSFFATKINAEEELNNNDVKEIISCLASRNVVTSAIGYEKEITIEGISYITVLYLSDNDDVKSLNLELPYSVNLADDTITINESLSATANVLQATCKLTARGIEIKCDVLFSVCAKKYVKESYIGEVQIGEKNAENDCNLIFYFPSANSDLWKIAKALRVSIDELKKQNEKLDDTVSESDRISYYSVIKDND